ncbi:hypothetical protein [Cohnella sp. REN36]|uniref:hypothetical protein n=1 Tax=Cohnella sp. REN36 TaxID=2887347 RepID=UPI001D147750|nr:hypothetical protein [Cohnella sp. REN36]MCC3376100.1 hypothetical protein [Cohnella sp. REN36]
MTNNRLAGVIRLHSKDKLSWLLIPWIVVMASFVVNLVISQFLEEDLYTGGVASLYAYMLAIGVISLTNTYPFAIGMGVRRHDYFWGTAAAAAFASLYSAVVLTVLSYVEYDLTDGWGSGLHFFHVPYLSDGSPLVQVAVYFLLIVNLFFMGFMTTCVFKRFGILGLLGFAVVMLILGTVASFIMTKMEWWADLFDWFNAHKMLEIALLSVPVTLVFMLVSYALLRRSKA